MPHRHLPAPVLLEAEDLGVAHGKRMLFAHLSFAVRPGLTLVRGGDGRGKTTLLRLMAGSLTPSAGVLRRHAATLFHEDMADPAHDGTAACDWLALRRVRFPQWDAACEERLCEAFGLAAHIAKPIHMLSTGSRRKLGLLASAASGAQLTLIDNPFAALDAASVKVLCALLAEAAADETRAWVLADYVLADGLAGVDLCGVIDLGG